MNRKKILWGIAIAFMLYAVYTQPSRSGDTVQSGFGMVETAGRSVGTFFSAMMS